MCCACEEFVVERSSVHEVTLVQDRVCMPLEVGAQVEVVVGDEVVLRVHVVGSPTACF